ncbi:hypothetical protein KM043_008372 [Ampulex compressa]|nr:hypothetical protein KM043_008372 [Ampulex compressa]
MASKPWNEAAVIRFPKWPKVESVTRALSPIVCLCHSPLPIVSSCPRTEIGEKVDGYADFYLQGVANFWFYGVALATSRFTLPSFPTFHGTVQDLAEETEKMVYKRSLARLHDTIDYHGY